MHKRDQVSILIATLLEGHTVTSACKRAGVSRMFYDRHYKTDRGFRKEVDDARAAGRNTNQDLIATMYLKKVRDGHWPAIHYAMKKQDIVESEKPTTGQFGPGDIRTIIDSLPKEAQDKHNTHLRELLDDVSEFQRTGRIDPPDEYDL